MQESSISEKIKDPRTDLKMNQKNFSAAIGIRQSTLSSYENGVVTPSNDVLLTIAQKFHPRSFVSPCVFPLSVSYF